jgi:hypothetical protein
MVIHDDALHLAGLALAHALWSASDLEGDDLVVPLAFVREGEQTKLIRFEANTQEEAVRLGHESMKELTAGHQSWAFARDGILREKNEPVDVIVVEAWAPGSEANVTVLQRYVPFKRYRKFRLQGEMELGIAGSRVAGAAAEGALSVVREGILSHTAVAELVPAWQTGG